MTQGVRARAAFVSGLVFVGMILGVAVVVMALSGQSSNARSAQASTSQGRYAAEVAESAIDECLAEFTDVLAGKLSGQDPRALFVAKAEGGVVPAAALTNGAAWSFAPARTVRMLKDARASIEVSAVSVKPLYYSTVQNFGEVELSCHASYRLGARELYRRVDARHYFVLDADGRTFRVNPVAISQVVDRSAD